MTQGSSKHPDNPYPIDVESAAEMTRLLDQDQLLTEAMGGIFPERSTAEIAGLTQILDIACGPGGWVQEVAMTYPHIEVTGIDVSEGMVEYAQAFAKARSFTNAHFRVMDALKPLDFPDNSFDLVNMRALVGVVAPAQWPQLLAECQRILRPGSTIRMTEGEWGFTNKPALEQILALGSKSMQLVGRSFSPTGHSLGLVAVMKRLVRQAGFSNLQSQAYVVDNSYGTKSHAGAYEDIRSMVELIKPFLLRVGAISAEDFDRLVLQALKEMQEEDYCACWFMLTVWGEKSV